MKNLKVFVFLFFFPLIIIAQQFESWKNFTNTNDVRKITVENNNLWAVTSGGLFKYDLSTGVFNTYTKAENFSSQDLTALAVDRNGMVWVGSREGYINILNPANGSVTKIYDIYNSSRTQKGINDFSINGDTLFVSHGFGLSLINTNTHGFMDNVIKFGDLPTESKVLSVSRFSRIFACLTEGLAIQKAGATNLFAPDSWDSYLNSSLQMNKAVSFKNEIYVATNNGLYKFNSGAFTLFNYPNEEVIDLFVQGTNLYSLTKTRLYRYSTTSEQIFEKGSLSTTLSGFAFSATDSYISSNNGITKLSQSGTTSITTNSPVTNTFMKMDVDTNGNLWVGTGKDANGKGIMLFNGSSWSNFNAQTYSTMVTNDYHNVYAGTDNKIYWMNWGLGCAVYSNSQITLYSPANTPISGIPANPEFLVISDVKNDTKGNTWFLNFWPADRNILWSLQPDNSWQSYNFPSITDNQVFTRLVIDKYNTKWIAVSANIQGGKRGILAFNESLTTPKNQYYSSLNGLPSDFVNDLAVDRRGYIWIGTSTGICHIPEPSNPTIIKSTNATLMYQNISCLAVDALDQKWIGTKAGLFVYNANCETPINHYDISNSPLPSNEITSLAIDKKNGIIYIGTDYGLTVLKTDFVEPKETFEDIVTFPSPYVIGDGKNTQLKIDGLIKDSSIKILTLTGKLIYEAKTSGGRIGFWDGRDQYGAFVSSGIYFIIAYDQEGNNIAKGKFVIIKK